MCVSLLFSVMTYIDTVIIMKKENAFSFNSFYKMLVHAKSKI